MYTCVYVCIWMYMYIITVHIHIKLYVWLWMNVQVCMSYNCMYLCAYAYDVYMQVINMGLWSLSPLSEESHPYQLKDLYINYSTI